MLKKVFTTLIILFGLLASNLALSAQEDPEPISERGYQCINQQCISCDSDEPGCQEGSCSAFTCSEEEDQIPLTPIITNLEELTATTFSNKNIRVRGVGEENSIIKFFLDGTEVKESTISSTGEFDILIDNNAIGSGEYDLSAESESLRGTKSNTSNSVEIIVDADEPEIELGSIPDFTNFKSILVSGNTEPGSRVTVANNGTQIYNTGADQNGNFDVLLAIIAEENQFLVEVTDKAGNTSSTQVNIRKDTSIENNIQITDSTSGIITLEVPEGIVSVEVLRNDEVIEYLEVSDEKVEFDIGQYNANFRDQYVFSGIDSLGNITESITYTNNNTGVLLLMALGLLLITTVGSYTTYYLYKTGKINFRFVHAITKNFNDQLTFINPKVNTVKTKKEHKNIKPDNISKEY